MSQLLAAKETILDTNGDPVSGGKIYFYEAGTTTPLATYSDTGLTTANANPLVADGDGRLGPAYGQIDKLYKKRYTDSSDNIIYEVDNVPPLATSSQASSTSGAIATTPLQYGAVGDGLNDESTAVQAAIDAADGVVDLLGLTFRCDAQISLASGKTLQNGTLNFSNAAAIECVSIAGSQRYGTPIGITSPSQGDITLTAAVTGTGIAQGDLLRIAIGGSPALYAPGEEIALVDSATASTATLDKPIALQGYSSSDTIEEILNPIRSAQLKNLTIVGGTSPTTAIRVDKARDVLIDNVRVTSLGTANNAVGLHVTDSYRVTARCVSVFDDNSSTNGITGVRLSRSRFVSIEDLNSVSGASSTDHNLIDVDSGDEGLVDFAVRSARGGRDFRVEAWNANVDDVEVSGDFACDGTNILASHVRCKTCTMNTAYGVNCLSDSTIINSDNTVALTLTNATAGDNDTLQTVRGCLVRTGNATAIDVNRGGRTFLSGNHAYRGDDTGACITVDNVVGSSGTVTTTLVGNVTENGTYGVEVGSGTVTAVAVGNIFTSAATAASTGLDVDTGNTT